jgi:hypothetical protein
MILADRPGTSACLDEMAVVLLDVAELLRAQDGRLFCASRPDILRLARLIDPPRRRRRGCRPRWSVSEVPDLRMLTRSRWGGIRVLRKIGYDAVVAPRQRSATLLGGEVSLDWLRSCCGQIVAVFRVAASRVSLAGVGQRTS